MIKSFLKEFVDNNGLVAHQINSYNDFVERKIQKIIHEIGKITIELPTGEELIIKLGKVRVDVPQTIESDGSENKGSDGKGILPQEARLRNLTYSFPLYLEMTPVFEEREHGTEEVKIGDIPVMVKSNLCTLSKMTKEELIKAGEDPYDPGGYFIVNGTERVIIQSEEIAPNRLILQKKGEEVVARINSEKGGYVQRHVFERKPSGVIIVRFANLVNTPVPIIVLMKALGLESDKEIISLVSKNKENVEDVYLNIYETDVTNKKESLEYLGRRMKVYQKEQRQERAQQILDNYLLSHLGQDPKSRIKKAEYLGIIMRKMILLKKGKIIEDDIDHYSNKRLKMTGDLLEVLFRSLILGRWGLIARLQYNYQKMMKRGRKLLKLQSVVVANILTKQLMRSMATGNWVGGKTGISQRLERDNFTRTTCHLRSVVSPLSSTQEHFEARELHSTQWGRLCAIRTPEGQNIGLRKFLALGAEVTVCPNEMDETKVISTLKNFGVINE